MIAKIDTDSLSTPAPYRYSHIAGIEEGAGADKWSIKGAEVDEGIIPWSSSACLLQL